MDYLIGSINAEFGIRSSELRVSPFQIIRFNKDKETTFDPPVTSSQ